MDLTKLLRRGKQIRSIGFDDTPHDENSAGSPVNIAGVVCSATRFEGMVWGELEVDGMNATDVILDLLKDSKFADQLHLMLLDGITFGGCNVVYLERLYQETNLPAVAVMRKHPDLERFQHVVFRFTDAEERWRRVQAAGDIHRHADCYFQVVGEDPLVIGPVLDRLTDQGKVPECLRLAHLIGSAVMLGESGKRA